MIAALVLMGVALLVLVGMLVACALGVPGFDGPGDHGWTHTPRPRPVRQLPAPVRVTAERLDREVDAA